MVALAMAAYPGYSQTPPPLPMPDGQQVTSNAAVLPPAEPQASVSAKPIDNLLNGLGDKTAPTVAAAAPETKTYSYGNSNLTILFLPAQMERLKTAVRTYENVEHETKPTFVTLNNPSVAAPEVKIEEPVSYPVFYLASIAYDTPNEWSLWISGHKITSRRNNTDLTIASVSPDSATFVWKPLYAPAITHRRAANQFAPLDGVKNKIAREQRVSQDENRGTLTFTLRQNQSFVVGYDKVFEGYVESPKLNAMTTSVAATNPYLPIENSPKASPPKILAEVPPSARTPVGP